MTRSGSALSHWHTLVDGFSTSGQDFYEGVEAAVSARDVPNAKFSRVLYSEGGIGSSKREYLRISRGKEVFDVCAAPYGQGFFFSWWHSRLGPQHPVLWLLVLFVGYPALCYWLTTRLENLSGSLVLLAVCALLGWVLLPLVAMRRELVFSEEEILSVPFLGGLYVKLFRPHTHYKQDTATMFQKAVSRAVHGVLDAVMSEHGVRALSQDEKKPNLRSLVA